MQQEVKIKKKWKDPGYKNDYFEVAPIMKPKVLNPWIASRVQAPERTFKKMCLNGVKDIKYTHSNVNDCGVPPVKLLSSRYRDILEKQQDKFKDFVQRPIKYT